MALLRALARVAHVFGGRLGTKWVEMGGSPSATN
jgi:hypothetical protein